MADETFKSPLKVSPPGGGDGSLRDLLDDVVYRLPGCSDLMVRKTLAAVWHDFAVRTEAMRFSVHIDIAEGERRYFIPVPAAASLIRVRWAAFSPKDARWTSPVPLRHYSVSGGANPFIELARPVGRDLVALYSDIFCEASFAPLRNTEDVPQGLLDKYGAAIADGAVYRLCTMSDKPWTNAGIAQQCLVSYENAVNEAALESVERADGEIDTVNRMGWA